MRVLITNGRIESRLIVTYGRRTGCRIDFIKTERVEQNIINLLDILILGQDVSVYVNDIIVDSSLISIKDMIEISNGYEHTVEFLNRGIYVLLQHIVNISNQEIIYPHGEHLKRHNWVDYMKGDIVNIPKDQSVFKTLRENQIFMKDMYGYGMVNAITMFQAYADDEYIDLDCILKFFTVDGIDNKSFDVTYNTIDKRLSIVDVAKVFRKIPGDLIQFSVKHENNGETFTKRVKEFFYDDYSRSIVISMED
ncbi:MAG: hypothetical protein ACRC92_20240 [Peptostreptococcaceae bacterium]